MDHSRQSDGIVIVDANQAHAAALQYALEARGYGVSVLLESNPASRSTITKHTGLVIYVPPLPARWKQELAAFVETIRGLEEPPLVLCVLPWRCSGPDDRLYGDQLNVRVVHEQQ